MVDYIPKLQPSPLFHNIWVMPIERDRLFSLLRERKGYLQTVGLSCDREDFARLTDLFFRLGYFVIDGFIVHVTGQRAAVWVAQGLHWITNWLAR